MASRLGIMNKLKQALKLSPDCFTPLSRTPWAGTQIQKRYKSNIRTSEVAIGESWEISCDPDFPSRVKGLDQTLLSLIQEEPEAMLSGDYVRRKGVNCEILVKLLNAASPLSVQVHPRDDDAALGPQECGKPESWLILDAEPGSGLYLGFSEPVQAETLRKLLETDADIRPYLQFVPVRAGDYFEIQPGVPHAIGPGITLLEPQRVLLGKSGKTYRFWDWGRRYNSAGALDMAHGKARELHVAEGMRLIDPLQQVGERFVDSLRRHAETLKLPSGGTVDVYPSNPFYQVIRFRIARGAELRLTLDRGFATLVSLGGRFSLTPLSTGHLGKIGEVGFAKGEPGFLPFAAFPLALRVVEEVDLVLILPLDTGFSWAG